MKIVFLVLLLGCFIGQSIKTVILETRIGELQTKLIEADKSILRFQQRANTSEFSNNTFSDTLINCHEDSLIRKH